MKETDCLGLPYPECDPPLVKDASDIIQFKALADATDAAVQEYADQVQADLLQPPSARQSGLTGGGAGQDFVQSYNTAVSWAFPASMGDLVAGGIRIPENGWYWVGGYLQITLTPQTAINTRIEPLVNGDPVSSRQGPSYSSGPGSAEDLTWIDCLFLQAGDVVTTMTHHNGNPATVISYQGDIWALQVLANG